MHAEDLLTFADELIFAQTGKHLDDLQKSILEGSLQGKRYSDIAEEYSCTDGHVKDVASRLWQIISEELGEEVKKKNFRATFERFLFSNVSNFRDFMRIGNFNLCKGVSGMEKPPKQSQRKEVSITLDNLPCVDVFYGRTQELATLKKWILNDKCRVVGILGVRGIGKTALTVKLVQQIQAEFDYVIYRNLSDFSGFEELLGILGDLFSQKQKNCTLAQLRAYLQKYRCLIVLDEVERIFCCGKLAGEYQANFEDFASLLQMINEVNHQSCLLFNSWFSPREIISLAGENNSVRLFYLPGLGNAAKEIMREKGLVDETQWSLLIDAYGGNPLWLKTVATLIKELFCGRVADYLSYDKLLLSEDLQAILNRQFQCLSELEKQIMSLISVAEKPISLGNLLAESQLSTPQLVNAIQSLIRRSLLEKIDGGESLFTVAPIWREFTIQKSSEL